MRMMTPSPIINQQNDRKFLLPSEYEIKYHIHLRQERPKSSFNTAQRVFTQYVLTNNNENITEYETTNSNFKKTAGHFTNRPVDSIGNIIAYKYAPDYRNQVII